MDMDIADIVMPGEGPDIPLPGEVIVASPNEMDPLKINYYMTCSSFNWMEWFFCHI